MGVDLEGKLKKAIGQRTSKKQGIDGTNPKLDSHTLWEDLDHIKGP